MNFFLPFYILNRLLSSAIANSMATCFCWFFVTADNVDTCLFKFIFQQLLCFSSRVGLGVASPASSLG